MATVTAAAAKSTVQPKAYIGQPQWVHSTFAIPATGDGTAANDVIEMVRVPKGARILSLQVTIDDVDTNVSPTHAFDVGDGGDADRFIDGSTKGQAGGVANLGDGVAAAAVGKELYHKFAADDTIDITITVVSATKAAGDVSLVASYVIE